MSADNWAICPRCLARAQKSAADMTASAMDSYGKVSVKEFDERRRKADAFAKDALDERQLTTFREDYEIGLYQGAIHVTYDGACATCGLALEFRDIRPVPGADQP